MPSLLQSMLDSLADPQRYHAMLVHMPIAVAIIGLVLTIGLIIKLGKAPGLRWTLVAIYIIGAGTAYRAADAGEHAQHQFDAHKITDDAREHVEEHEEWGEKVWLALALAGVCTALTGVKLKMLRLIALAIALVAALSAASVTAITAHYGGLLVYEDGAGVPTSPNNINADAPHIHDD